MRSGKGERGDLPSVKNTWYPAEDTQADVDPEIWAKTLVRGLCTQAAYTAYQQHIRTLRMVRLSAYGRTRGKAY